MDSDGSTDDAADNTFQTDELGDEKPEAKPENDISDEDSEASDHDAQDISTDPDTIMASEVNFHKAKLQRLRQSYNDAYLDLFNRTFDTHRTVFDNHYIQPDLDAEDFSTSQIGCITWTATDKVKFFDALSRYGRHDLPRISKSIETKSQIEVKAFIDLLHEAFVDRQLFERETKNISHAEISAAVEISPDLEESLELAADALQLVQEGYDLAAGQQKSEKYWIISEALAKVLDQESEVSADDDDAEKAGSSASTSKAYELFHLHNWLDISQKVFMNFPASASHDHWTLIAEPGQQPSITMDAIIDLRNLAVSLTQRLLQVSIFMAKSRIRASTNTTRQPAKILTQVDIHAALDVLQMKHDSWDYWARLPRRNQLTVYSDSHDKGKRSNTDITPAAAEKILLRMSKTRLSRSRSRSRGRSMSTEAESVIDEEDVTGHEAQQSLGDSREDAEPNDLSEDGDEVHETESTTSEEEERDGEEVEGTEPLDSRGMSKKRKRLLLEEAQDEYTDRLDRMVQRRHESELWQLFKESAPSLLKEDEHDADELGVRPRTLRKTMTELRTWTPTYEAEWERKLKLGNG